MKRITKNLCFLFAIVISFSIITSSLPTSFAASEAVADKVIEARLLEIEQVFANHYFTVNQLGCRPWEKSHGCPNCKNSTITEQSWFKTKAESLSWINNFDFASKRPNGFANYSSVGYSCHGFASTIWTILFADSTSGRLESKKIGTYSYSYNSVKDVLKPGDFIRCDNSHSAIVKSITPSGVVVIDNNSYYSRNCFTKVRTIPFSYYSTITISRCTTRNEIHKCTYNNQGRCTSSFCGEMYNFNASRNYNSDLVGNYSRKTSDKVAIKATPYAASNTVSHITSSKVKVDYTVVNHYGNVWVALMYDDASSRSCRIGYVYSGTLCNSFKKDSASSSSNAPLIFNASIEKNFNGTATLSWNSIGCSSFEVHYQKKDGMWVKDWDYTNNTSTSYTSSGLGSRDVNFRIRGYSSNGTASEYVYITYRR